MKASLAIGLFLLLAAAPTALAQNLGGINAIPGGPNGASMAADIISGKDAILTGFATRVSADSNTRLGSAQADAGMGRDGCINYPRQAHYSSDCSLLTAWNPDWKLPDKPVSQMTGAEENMLRSYTILTGRPLPERYR